MPKPFTETQKSMIKENLIHTGIKYLSMHPMKKIMLDWIVKDIGISKGAFYFFYDSKEALMFDCLMKIHEETNQRIFEEISKQEEKDKKSVLLRVLTTILIEVSKAPWLMSMDEDDYRLLAKKIGKEKLEEHFNQDSNMGEQVLAALGLKVKNLELVTASFRAIFLMFTNEKEIGEHIVFDVMMMQLKALIEHIFKEELV